MQTQDQLMRKFSELFQEPESATLESTMKEQTVFLEQLKQKQERQLEAQQSLMDVVIAEKHKTLRQVDGKLRRESNHQPKKKKKKRK